MTAPQPLGTRAKEHRDAADQHLEEALELIDALRRELKNNPALAERMAADAATAMLRARLQLAKMDNMRRAS